ncbi:hotdog fold domain-containing protein [Actinokineospora bangkokensis]|uniref:Thioesterase n=1 Tax=Actinokineospora bangkokensis TaxID=1193682 RepID=A0A1Q9LEF5_9PSEU|nr:hotdog fold domain-containing protein [Actinokineospora bangkokensis]OLR90394.1 thioesterase [Actinokineospora bangkokensis]
MGETLTFRAWRAVQGKPLGKVLFSAAAMVRVPYFRTVLPFVREMGPGRAVVSAPKWWGVHNHIGTFHAIAVCNMAEIAMGMLAEATVPTSHRWIPKGMSVEYTAKARTGLVATAEVVVPEFGGDAFELPVPVSIRDTGGTEVARAVITVWVTPAA